MTKAKTKTAATKKPVVKAKAKPAPKKTTSSAKAKPAAAAKTSTAKPAAAKTAAAKPVAAKPVATKPAPAAKAAAPVAPPQRVAPPHRMAPQHRMAPPAAPMSASRPAMSGPVVGTPAAKKLVFKIGELVVYPAHGVGKIILIEEQEIAGAKLELYIVDFEKEKLRLKVPTGRAEQKGMRRLSDKTQIDGALKILKGRARIKRTMWSRRAQEYDAKINSGDIMAVAEVVRDL